MKLKALILSLLFAVSAFDISADDIRYITQRAIDLPIAVQVGPSGIKEVEIWITENDGAKWKKGAVKTPKNGKLTYRTDRDGTYGFSIVVISKNGDKGDAPSKGDKPDMACAIDTMDPAIDFYSSKPGHLIKSGESVVIEWTIKDDNLDLNACGVLFSKDSGETWVAIAKGEPKGNRTYTGSAGINPVLFKVKAVDLAGRKAEEIIAFAVGNGKGQVKTGGTVTEKPVTVKDAQILILYKIIYREIHFFHNPCRQFTIFPKGL